MRKCLTPRREVDFVEMLIASEALSLRGNGEAPDAEFGGAEARRTLLRLDANGDYNVEGGEFALGFRLAISVGGRHMHKMPCMRRACVCVFP